MSEQSARTAYSSLLSAGVHVAPLSGYVAVGLYETCRYEWVISEEQRLGRSLTRQELDHHLSLLTPLMKQQIIQSADDALRVYAADAVQKEVPNAIKRYLAADRFWREVWVGVVAAFFYTLILIIAGFIVSLSSPDVFDWVQRVHQLVHPRTGAQGNSEPGVSQNGNRSGNGLEATAGGSLGSHESSGL